MVYFISRFSFGIQTVTRVPAMRGLYGKWSLIWYCGV